MVGNDGLDGFTHLRAALGLAKDIRADVGEPKAPRRPLQEAHAKLVFEIRDLSRYGRDRHVHPHRGFETVTIVYDGEVEHRDSAGNGGVIGRGDVQWMTAAGGILHEEFHSKGFTKSGGPFRMVQLWVNLPAKDKMAPARYQSILNSDISVVDLADGTGTARIIAGAFSGAKGPAQTFTPVNVWDLRINSGADMTLDLPEGHTAMLVVLGGHVTVNGVEAAGEAEVVLLDPAGTSATVHADGDATLLVLTGEPIDEPIVGMGPFVMNSDAEIRQALEDFNSGKFGAMAA